MSKNVKVTQSDPPVEKAVLAEAIVALGEAVQKLDRSGLNRKAIVILLQDITKLPRTTIEIVLDAIPKLRSTYCK
jgi:phenylpyruvate tautomerase PptA (4-oxalocrotonate tautomerase family)